MKRRHLAARCERSFGRARGKYFEKARRSFETIIVDRKVAATLGGAEGITALLEALAKSLGQAKKKRRAA